MVEFYVSGVVYKLNMLGTYICYLFMLVNALTKLQWIYYLFRLVCGSDNAL